MESPSNAKDLGKDFTFRKSNSFQNVLNIFILYAGTMSVRLNVHFIIKVQVANINQLIRDALKVLLSV